MSGIISQARAFRLGGFAILDFVAALWGTGYVAEQLGYTRTQGYMAAVPLGVAVHWALGIDTPLNRMLLNSRQAALAPPVRLANPMSSVNL